MWLSLGTLLWSVRLCSQRCISRANGDWLSQIEKHVVVSAFSVTSGRGCGGINLSQKSSTVWTKIWTPSPPSLHNKKISGSSLQRCYSGFFFTSYIIGSLVERNTKYNFVYVTWKLCPIMFILEEQETFIARLSNHSVFCGSVVPWVETSLLKANISEWALRKPMN